MIAMTRHRFHTAWIFVMTILVAGLHAQQHDSRREWFEHSHENAWRLPYDTTLLSRRVLSELSYESHDDDENFWKIENSVRGAYALSDDLAFGVQMMVPVRWIDSPASDESGIGDLELRSGFIGRFSNDLRWAAGINTEFDTATDSALGGNAWNLRPTMALRWDATDWLNLGINVEYTFTPMEERDDDVSALELKFPVVIRLSDSWSAAATYKPRWNFLNESDRHRLELGVTQVWGPENQFALSFSLEVPLTSESIDYKLVAGFAWHF
jgi:hypothetical protein